MNLFASQQKKSSDLWCGKRKRPSAFIMFNGVGHLTVTFLFNSLNIKHYEPFNQRDSDRQPIRSKIL